LIKITQNTQFGQVLVETNVKSISAIHAIAVRKNLCAEVWYKIFNLNFNMATSDKKADK
jgi:hypothetical protein